MKRTRDMSRAQFQAALKRHGFRWPILFSCSATPGISYGGIFTTDGKLRRRATLADLIRKRDVEIAKSEMSIRSPGFTNPDAKTVQEIA